MTNVCLFVYKLDFYFKPSRRLLFRAIVNCTTAAVQKNVFFIGTKRSFGMINPGFTFYDHISRKYFKNVTNSPDCDYCSLPWDSMAEVNHTRDLRKEMYRVCVVHTCANCAIPRAYTSLCNFIVGGKLQIQAIFFYQNREANF